MGSSTVLVSSCPQAIMDGAFHRPAPLVDPRHPTTYICRKGWDLTRRRTTIPETCEGTEIPSNASGNRLDLLIAVSALSTEDDDVPPSRARTPYQGHLGSTTATHVTYRRYPQVSISASRDINRRPTFPYRSPG